MEGGETRVVCKREKKNKYQVAALCLFVRTSSKIKNKDDSKIKRETNLDRHGSRPIINVCHLLGPPSFSLQTTFNVNKCSIYRILIFGTVNLANSIFYQETKSPPPPPPLLSPSL
jgi:hypothetical protein